jgi:hypothetical protein
MSRRHTSILDSSNKNGAVRGTISIVALEAETTEIDNQSYMSSQN